MSFSIIANDKGKVRIKKTKREMLLPIIGKTATALGNMVFDHFKDKSDPSNYDALVEISEKVIIPCFLEGAGCRRKEES